jgi:hypothetical protein
MHKIHILEGNSMQTIYINGVKATRNDLVALFERVRQGLDRITDVYTTKSNNIAVRTA